MQIRCPIWLYDKSLYSLQSGHLKGKVWKQFFDEVLFLGLVNVKIRGSC